MTRQRSESSGPDLLALLEGWPGARHGSLAQRLAHALRQVLDAGVLPSGWRFPPERALAQQLDVGRTTVTAALNELRAEGRVSSRQGSGTFVAGAPRLRAVGTRLAEHLVSGPGIDLAKGDAPDLSHLPPVSLDIAQLTSTCGGAAVHVAGLPAMREAVAELYTTGRTTGMRKATHAEQIHITAGSHQASALLMPMLAGERAAVAVAACTYAGIFDILDACRLKAVPVRMDAAGMLPESLDQVLRRDKPNVLYFQAGPQVPTGRLTPPARMRSIAEVLDHHGTTVVEDTTVAAVAFDEPVTFLADHCRHAPVISTGSLSKTCCAGLRVGWLRAPTATVQASIFRHVSSDLGVSIPSQLLAMQLLPHLDRIVQERRRRLRASVEDALEQLAVVLPAAKVERPGGNSILWLEFPLADTAPLVHLARRNGVRIAPGSIHFSDKEPGPFVRIDVDRAAPLVREGIDRLARSWSELATGRRRRSAPELLERRPRSRRAASP